MGVAARKRARKAFQYNVNRKRMRSRIEKKNWTVRNKVISKEFDKSKSTLRNAAEAGLVFCLNKIEVDSERDTDRLKIEHMDTEKRDRVVAKMEKAAKSCLEKQEVALRMPKSEVDFLEKMISKYGDDYYAMFRDPMNYYQATPDQIKKKIRTLLDNPSYLIPRLKKEGIIPSKNKRVPKKKKRKTKKNDDGDDEAEKQEPTEEVEKPKRPRRKRGRGGDGTVPHIIA